MNDKPGKNMDFVSIESISDEDASLVHGGSASTMKEEWYDSNTGDGPTPDYRLVGDGMIKGHVFGNYTYGS